MSTIRNYHPGPRMWAAILFALLIVLGGELSLIFWTYEQSRTQHQICQAFQFVGQSTQHGIDTNSQLVRKDLKINTKDSLADAVIRRESIKTATDFLIRVRRVQC